MPRKNDVAKMGDGGLAGWACRWMGREERGEGGEEGGETYDIGLGMLRMRFLGRWRWILRL